MRKYFIIFLFQLLQIEIFGQSKPPLVTLAPSMEGQGEKSVRVQKIEITDAFTIVSFVHTNLSNTMWIQIMPSIKIIGAFGKRTFKFIKTEGIPVAPEKYIYTQNGQRKYFRIYFEKIDPGIEKIDIFECTNTDQYVCFNFYGVKINNPLPPAPITPVKAQKNNKPTPLPPANNILIKGVVLDSKTKKPISCSINFQFAASQKQAATLKSNSLGQFSLKLKGGFFYNCVASSNGYLVAEEPLNTIKFVQNQTFKINFTLKPIEIGETISLKNIYFAQGEYKVLDASFAELDKLTKIMQSNPTLEIVIEGHTDIIGNPSDNMMLSENRVNAVKEYLIKKGINAKRVQTKAYGGTKPIVQGGTDEERQVNRRVEFKILKK